MTHYGIDVSAIDTALTTTRAVRARLDLTRPVPRELVVECVRIAQQAPTAANRQHWAFVIVDDPDQRRAVADEHRLAVEWLVDNTEATRRTDADADVVRSSIEFSQRLREVPMLLIACVRGAVPGANALAQGSHYASVYPAVWSFAVAARARGLGTTLTTVHLARAEQIAQIIGLPDGWSQAALLPVAYYTGETFQPGRRQPVDDVIHWNTWRAEPSVV